MHTSDKQTYTSDWQTYISDAKLHTSDIQAKLGADVSIFAHVRCQNNSQTDQKTYISDVKIHTSDKQPYTSDWQTYISDAKLHTSDIQAKLGAHVEIFAHVRCQNNYQTEAQTYISDVKMLHVIKQHIPVTDKPILAMQNCIPVIYKQNWVLTLVFSHTLGATTILRQMHKRILAM